MAFDSIFKVYRPIKSSIFILLRALQGPSTLEARIFKVYRPIKSFISGTKSSYDIVNFFSFIFVMSALFIILYTVYANVGSVPMSEIGDIFLSEPVFELLW